MGDLPSRDDLLKVMDLVGGRGEPANILHTTSDHLRAYLPVASPDFVLDIALGLLDLLDQERAENAAMRPIVEAVAADTTYSTGGADWSFCLYCDGNELNENNIVHLPTCPHLVARALLAKEAQE